MKIRIQHILSLCLVLLILLPVCCLFLSSCTQETELFRVAVLDVGQSDAILLSQGEQHMLIDTGSVTERDALLGELARFGVRRLAYLLLTHPHEDHVGNARTVLEHYPTQALLTSAAVGEEESYRLATETAARLNCPQTVLRKGDSFALGNALCEVLFAADEADDEPNNGSVILRVQFGEDVFLFMGDAESELESTLLYLYPNEKLDCDFLKVGHHGSDTATTARFLAVTTPLFAAISCGADNEYGFPHDAVTENLTRIGAAIMRTDTSGTLIYQSNGSEIRYIPFQNYVTAVLPERGRKEWLL